MVETLAPDICVIGAGSGGLSVAAAAAAFGVPVVLIEKDRMGGDCLNSGCIPSKALIAAAKRLHLARSSEAFGVSAQASADFARVHAHVKATIASVAPNDSVERFTGLGVRVIKGEGRFVDRNTVAVGSDILVKARRFVIATGSSPVIPPIPGLAGTPYLTNETIFDLTACPTHLLVIGAGPVGLELAQAFRRFGVAVTVVEVGAALAHEDEDCGRVVLDHLRQEGIAIREHSKIARVGGDEGAIRLELDTGEVMTGSHLLVAAGRRVKTGELGLDKASIAHGVQGIVVNKGLRTTNRRVYAIGDAAGGLQFTHAANQHAGLIIRNALFRLPVSADDSLIPHVVFTDPELAQAGMSEQEARENYAGIRILRWPYQENDRAAAERQARGHIKVITTRRGRILGATIVGAEAGELISAWALAISERLNIRAMAGVVLPYPTRAEIGKRAAMTFFAGGLTSPFVRRIVRFLRKFG